jgi:CubicO group peptidase (beta-lactamase class C family)
MKSVEKGKLSLEQTIDIWFPQIPNASRITVRHLLNHRSGIHNFTDVPTYLRWNTAYRNEQQMLDTIAAQLSDFEPGTKASYSNSGYVLLTLILQKVWGRTYGTLLQKYILLPGKLKETTYAIQLDTMGIHAQSYRKVFGWWRQSITDASVPLGAGAISATAADLALFGSKLFEGKFITKESIAEMQKLVDNIGMGLFRFPFYERWSYGHGGSIDGFQSIFSCFPKEKLTYVLLSNGSAIPTNDVSIAILSAIFGKSFEIPSMALVELSSKELELYTGTYMSKKLPVKITVFQKDSKMYAQATGQMPFPLVAHGAHRFSNEKAGIEMDFSPQKNEMLLKQGGGSFLFNRE